MIFLFEIIKKKERRPMHKIFILQVVISPLARLDLHFRNSNVWYDEKR